MFRKTYFDLHQFDETVAGGSGFSGDAGHTSGAEEKEKKVIYGKSAETDPEPGNESHDADDKGDDSDPENLEAEFEDLIKGKYKDLYDKRVQDNIARRFKGQQEKDEQLNAYEATLGPLYAMYGIENGDLDALNDAIMNDDQMYAATAEELGLTPEQYRQSLLMQAESERRERELEQLRGAQQAQQDYQKWVADGTELQKLYPNFNLAEEVKNPDFLNDLKAGKPMRKAYEAAHLDDILGGAIVKTAEETAKNITNNIKARGMRPAENGTGNRPGVIVKKDPNKFDKKDFEEIMKRVQRGEHIEF